MVPDIFLLKVGNISSRLLPALEAVRFMEFSKPLFTGGGGTRDISLLRSSYRPWAHPPPIRYVLMFALGGKSVRA